MGNRLQLKMSFRIVTHKLDEEDLKIKSSTEYVKIKGRKNNLWWKFKGLWKKREPIYIYSRDE